MRASVVPIKVIELYKLEIAKLMHQRHKQNLPVASQNFLNHFPLYMSIQSDQNQNKLYSPKLFTLRCQNLSNIMVPKFGILSHLKLESNRSVNLKHE